MTLRRIVVRPGTCIRRKNAAPLLRDPHATAGVARIGTMNCPGANIDDACAALPAPPLADLAAIALFLDVDGTLIDFALRPDAVAVDPALPPLLRRLHARLDGALAPLSGRPLHEIDALLGLPQGAAAGVHGSELRDAQGRVHATAHASARMPALQQRARDLLAAHGQVLIEVKADALALHYRNAPAAASAVHAAAQELLRHAGRDYVLQPGNQVMEIKPAGVDKGHAVTALMRAAPFAGRVPWMLGDDLTDEDAFAVVNAHAGVSVIVGPRRPTLAHCTLADPPAARAWLAALLERDMHIAPAPQA